MFGLVTVRIIGPSMEPRLRNGETYLVRTGVRPKIDDIVVFRHPERPELLSVKRVVRQEDGGWWVEGDNPAHSTDSRAFGVIHDGSVVGRVVMRVRPIRRRPGGA